MPRVKTVHRVLALAVVLAPACAGKDAPAEAAGPVAAASSARAPVDLGAIMRRARLGYRAEGDAWVGGSATYVVRASGDGFAVTPIHHERPSAALADDDAAGDVLGPVSEPPARIRPGTPIRFTTTSIARGSQPRAAASLAPRRLPGGELALGRGEVVEEHLENREDGVEQSYDFSARPAGSGDLVVRVRVSGAGFAGRTSGGHHFKASATGLGLRYGEATWVDARGTRTPVDVGWSGETSELLLRVPGSVVDAASYPAVLDPIVSPEIDLDKPVYGPAIGRQEMPAVAHDGKNFLVVWESYDELGFSSSVRGALVGEAGALLDPQGFEIEPAGGSYHHEPVVAWTGTTYVVAWETELGGISTWDIAGIALSPLGVPLGPSKAISQAGNTQRHPAIAAGGGQALVVWEDLRNGTSNDIYGARVAANGAVLDASGLQIGAATNEQNRPAVAFDGTSWVVAWHDYRSGTNHDLYAARVTQGGQPLDAAGIAVSTATGSQMYPAMASDGNGTFIVWRDYRSGSSYDIYGARLSTAGAVLDASGIVISTATGSQRYPALGFDGTNYLAVWEDRRSNNSYDVYGARVSPAGSILDPAGIAIAKSPSDEANLAVAAGIGSSLVVWDATGDATDVMAARVSPNGAVLDASLTVSVEVSDQQPTAAGFDGTNWLVVWSDSRQGRSNLYGTRVSTAGVALDPAGILLIDTPARVGPPRLAFDGTNYLLVWTDNRSIADQTNIFGARVTPSGAVLDPGGFAIAAGGQSQQDPAIAFGGGGYLVAWMDDRNGATAWDLYAARVTPGGAVLDPQGFELTAAAKSQGYPDLAYAGGHFFAVWEDLRNGASADVFGARVDSSGAVLDPAGVAISTADEDQRLPRIAANGAGFFVAWADDRGPTRDIYGARVDAAANVADMDGIAIATGMEGASSPLVTFDGTNHVIAWQRDDLGAGDVYAARVGLDGAIVNPSPFPVADGAQTEAPSAAVAGPPGTVLVSYTGDDPSSGKLRGHARVVNEGPPVGNPCASAADCASGFCVDGVCCNEACGGGVNDCTACSVAAGAAANGVCGPATGPLCDDDDACTSTDVCQSGACVGKVPVVCSSPGDPCLIGVCVPATGVCAPQPLPDGTACPGGGTCVGGVCEAGAGGGGMAGAGGTAGAGGEGMAGAGGEGMAGAGGEGMAGAGGQGGGGGTGEGPQLELEDDGCGCRTAPASAPAAPTALALALLGLVRRRAGGRRPGQQRR
ncbi:MYXO-CTERM sorting domain-containing protein [Polyangium aurulentum]|uniref:MYXO-CTERM sorting domain-containing protein n=1 Tax=Polyangium aurulentum TaxID=2567896 RepID=UPI0010AE08B0|nr:MYXO-CTERM sorting domain-containing protein [Polyangium aurulentum]UQA64072.1 hypothetical protein E8A73_023825 [Polyangium aurulentum]